jgi:hypothetical protein
MKCPKCGYTSFPYLESCRKCGHTLAEQRAALGVYALRPDPPDLLLAYQAANTDLMAAIPRQPVTAPSLDLGPLEKIELELGEAGSVAPSTDEGAEQVGGTTEGKPTPAGEPPGKGAFPAAESRAEGLRPPPTIMPQSLDLSGLEGIPFEVDNGVTAEGKPGEGSQPPKDAATEEPVYDLDLDEELGGLTLRPLVNESEARDVDDEAKVAEYTLEIEDEVEFDIDELELEQDDDAEAEDDGER